MPMVRTLVVLTALSKPKPGTPRGIAYYNVNMQKALGPRFQMIPHNTGGPHKSGQLHTTVQPWGIPERQA